MNRVQMLVLTLLAGLLTMGLAHAGPGEEGQGRLHSRSAHLMQAVASLDLTVAQQEAIEAIQAEAQAEREAMREEHRGAREAMRDLLLSSEALDRDAAHAALEADAARRQARAHQELDSLLDVLEILTPDQRLALAEHLEAARPERRTR